MRAVILPPQPPPYAVLQPDLLAAKHAGAVSVVVGLGPAAGDAIHPSACLGGGVRFVRSQTRISFDRLAPNPEPDSVRRPGRRPVCQLAQRRDARPDAQRVPAQERVTHRATHLPVYPSVAALPRPPHLLARLPAALPPPARSLSVTPRSSRKPAAFAASAIPARSTAKACCQSNTDTKHRWVPPSSVQATE